MCYIMARGEDYRSKRVRAHDDHCSAVFTGGTWPRTGVILAEIVNLVGGVIIPTHITHLTDKSHVTCKLKLYSAMR